MSTAAIFRAMTGDSPPQRPRPRTPHTPRPAATTTTSSKASPSACFLRPTVRAKIKHRKELARIRREENMHLRKLSNTLVNGSRLSSTNSWRTTVKGIREHHEALRKYVDDQGKRDMQEAEEVEKIAGSGCTCGLQLEPTILDKLLENLARFPRPVARIVGLYLPPKTTPKIEVSKQQAEIIGRVIAGQNVFFTGKAGTGKTFLLKQLRTILCGCTHFFTAMTGQAAAAIHGTTLHSFAGIKMGKGGREILLRNAMRDSSRGRWQSCKVLVIDEVSMLSAKLLEDLDFIAKTTRGSTRPFGGIQVVFSGDFHQLPPVESNGRLCFESKIFTTIFAQHQRKLLTKVFRQQDSTLEGLLEEVRAGTLKGNSLKLLRWLSRPLCQHNGIIPTKLCARNVTADKINEKRLGELPGSLHVFAAQDEGSLAHREALDKTCSAPKHLQLKVGAQVVATRPINYCYCEEKQADMRTDIHNGQRGIITGFKTVEINKLTPEAIQQLHLYGVDVSAISEPVSVELPRVKFADGSEHLVSKHRFSLEKKVQRSDGKYEMETLASREQLPLKLAWAMTIHRSQGMTIDKLAVSLAGIFECGQAYVALSRATSLKSLEVRNFYPNSIKSNWKVKKFYSEIKLYCREGNFDYYERLATQALNVAPTNTQKGLAKSPERKGKNEVVDLTSTNSSRASVGTCTDTEFQGVFLEEIHNKNDANKLVRRLSYSDCKMETECSQERIAVKDGDSPQSSCEFQLARSLLLQSPVNKKRSPKDFVDKKQDISSPPHNTHIPKKRKGCDQKLPSKTPVAIKRYENPSAEGLTASPFVNAAGGYSGYSGPKDDTAEQLAPGNVGPRAEVKPLQVLKPNSEGLKELTRNSAFPTSRSRPHQNSSKDEMDGDNSLPPLPIIY